MVFVGPFREAALLPLVEQGVRFPGLAGVVGEVGKIGLTASRRLQLAAEASGTTVLLCRVGPWAEAEQTLARIAPRGGEWKPSKDSLRPG